MSYTHRIARSAGDAIAALFETEVMDLPGSCMRECAFANIRLPLTVGTEAGQVPVDQVSLVGPWLRSKSAGEMDMYVQTLFYRGAFWWRICGQIYMELEDYVEAARRVATLLERIKGGELS
jgi:hypothetical protein